MISRQIYLAFLITVTGLWNSYRNWLGHGRDANWANSWENTCDAWRIVGETIEIFITSS